MSITASLGNSFTSVVAHTTHLPSHLPRVSRRPDRPATDRATAAAVPAAEPAPVPVRAESVRFVDVATTMARYRSQPDAHAASRAFTTSFTR